MLKTRGSYWLFDYFEINLLKKRKTNDANLMSYHLADYDEPAGNPVVTS